MHASELKQIAGAALEKVASPILMNRIFHVLDETPDPKSGAAKVEKLVALFLGVDQAKALGQSFRQVVG